MKWLLLALLLAPSVLGATIQGIVYDFGLEPLDKTVVRINTIPVQVKVAIDGSYSFSVPQGNYLLNATTESLFVEEHITVVGGGAYTLDLILLPFVDEVLFEELPPIDVEVRESFFEERPPVAWLSWLFVFIAVVLVVYVFSKRQKPDVLLDEQLQNVLDFIDKEGGRTTQKEIRKAFPLSEAKISLMLHELEVKGLIKRLKKGRGNIVVRV